MYTVARLRLDKMREIRGRVLSLSHLVAVGAVCAVGVVGVVMICVVSIRVDLAVSITFGVFCSRRVLSLPRRLRFFVACSTR